MFPLIYRTPCSTILHIKTFFISFLTIIKSIACTLCNFVYYFAFVKQKRAGIITPLTLCTTITHNTYTSLFIYASFLSYHTKFVIPIVIIPFTTPDPDNFPKNPFLRNQLLQIPSVKPTSTIDKQLFINVILITLILDIHFSMPSQTTDNMIQEIICSSMSFSFVIAKNHHHHGTFIFSLHKWCFALHHLHHRRHCHYLPASSASESRGLITGKHVRLRHLTYVVTARCSHCF